MKRKKYIVWMLVVINLIMLTAAVIPHHHHKEILCLQHDIDNCSSKSPRSQSENKECQACCVTKAFCFVQQQNANYVPVYDLPAITLFTLTDVLNLLPPEAEIRIYSFIYKESLHKTWIGSSIGLRAPPSELAA